jgi:hypothetical protein
MGSVWPVQRGSEGPFRRKPRNESVKRLAPDRARSAESGGAIDFTGVGIGSGCATPPAASPDPSPAVRPPPGAMETAHEVAIYIDRFHNLDLFHQG